MGFFGSTPTHVSSIMLLGTTSQRLKYNNNNNSSDNDFIGVDLGGMGHSCRSYKKTIPNFKFIRGRFQTEIYLYKKNLKKNILQIMFQNVLMDPKILKNTQISLFFSMSFEIFVSFQLLLFSCLFNFIHMLTCNFIQI
jgi:hypothetical protein